MNNILLGFGVFAGTFIGNKFILKKHWTNAIITGLIAMIICIIFALIFLK